MNGEKYTMPQPYTKNSRQMRKVGHGRGALPQERVHEFVVQCQAVSSETNIQIILWGLNTLYFRMHLHVHMCMQ